MAKTWSRSTGYVNKLSLALEYNDLKTVKSLISHGANVNHRFLQCAHRRHGMTPISIAVSKNSKEMVQLLLKAGAELEQEDPMGETPLFQCVRHAKMSMLKQIVEAGANFNHQNKRGESVLFLAIKWGKRDIVEYLLNKGCHADLINKEGSSPLLLALELHENACTLHRCTRRKAPSNMKEIIELLIPLSSNLNHHHPNKGSALQIALSTESQYFPQDLHLSQLLMQHGAVPDKLFFLRFGGLHASRAQQGSQFFTSEFFNLALLAGANIQREKAWLLMVFREMPEELQPREQLFEELLNTALHPQSLENICRMTIRKVLGGRIWDKVDQLELPKHMKDSIKLKIL